MKIILLGPPGAGKGTQAEKITENFHLVHISTGDIFRENLKNNTPLGQKAKEYMDKGLLVPDDVTVSMVEDRISKDDCVNGYMLDGFPRTIEQAKALDEILAKKNEELSCALAITVDYELLTERITGRRICRDCGATYHITFNPSKEEGKCDKCSGELYQRSDDKVETVKTRLSEYDEKTQPLTTYYEAQGKLKTVDGMQSIDEVTLSINKILEEYR